MADTVVIDKEKETVMYAALNTNAIGVHPRDLSEAIEYARIGGFQGLEIDAKEVAELIEQRGEAEVRRLFTAAHIRPAGWGLPVDWRGSEEIWRADLEALPRLAVVAAAIGATRCSTWIPPSSDERSFEENRLFHLQRFTPIARILADHGCSLGLEFIGPKTFRDQWRYPFVYRMEDMLRLGAEIGPNVGLLLDCWHWYTSGGTLDDLQALRVEQVVYVHINDAPAGIERDEQLDLVRALPGETGVIDITGFLHALQRMHYEGPVVPEPFKKELEDLPTDVDRLRAVGDSVRAVFARASLI